MHLYNLTLQSPGAVNQAVIGSFTGTKSQEIALAKNGFLELLKIDMNTGKLVQILETPMFGIIRSLSSFRVTGGSKDYLIVGSDSGRIVILEYLLTSNTFVRVHMETYGKSGVRRIVPGEYLATDPKGRAVMIAAMEKQKFVYILNRDAATRLTISSPLEAHRSNTILFDLVGIDVAFDNPIFAAIEVDYTEIDECDPTLDAPPQPETNLVYYELDLGLNHVVRKWSDPIDSSSHKLLLVPGGTEGPSGVLVCSEHSITWKHQGQTDIQVPIPRRVNYLEDVHPRSSFINAAVTHKLKNKFFILVQTDEGDVFRIHVDHQDGNVLDLRIKYFDTLPIAQSLIILKSGYLFIASEFGNHHLYSIDDLGDSDEDQPEYTSADSLLNQPVYFRPRELKNLTLVDTLDSTHPLMDAKVFPWTKEETPPLYTLCGRGAQSSFRILRHGLEMAELAVTEVPANPKAIWTTKLKASDPYDSYIVVSFADATVVFAIGDTVEEIHDSGLLSKVSTLLIQQMGQDDLVQVHPSGIRHVKADKRTFEWKCPLDRTITCATANARQIMLALSTCELVYFELDAAGLLSEFPERKKMPAAVTCMDMGEVPLNRLRNRFVAVGTLDNIVRILSLDPDTCMEGLSMQALNSVPESLCAIEMKDTTKDRGDATYLNIGLQNGVLIRSTIDPITGELLDSRLRFLGPKSPKLFRIRVAGENALLALSTRIWLNYVFQGKTKMSPVNYELLDHASSFASEQCPEGIVAVSKNTVRIVMPDHLGKNFQQTSVELNYTPRKFTHHPLSHYFVFIESDQNTYAASESDALLAMKAEEFQDTSVTLFKEEFPEAQYGLLKSKPGKWASCIRLMNPFDGTTAQFLPLPPDEAAFSLCIVQFASQPHEYFLIVGTMASLNYPKTCKEASLLTYQFVHGGTQLEFIHKTVVEAPPLAMTGFQGRLAVGIGKILRIYDLGKKKLLRKTENRQLVHLINGIHTQGNRLVVTDLQESVHFVMYRYQDNKLVVFADDVVPRWTTCSLLLDFDTIVLGDRFGTLSILRLPKSISTEIEEDTSGNRILYEKGCLNGAPHKLELIASFYLGEWITSLTKTTLVPGGRDLILYTTLGGLVGCVIPFSNKEDVDFFVMLEMHLRQEHDSLIGRDHMHYRSYYTPVKNVIDGDLCEQYLRISQNKKDSIAQDMDRTVLEINKKLEDFRARVAF